MALSGYRRSCDLRAVRPALIHAALRCLLLTATWVEGLGGMAQPLYYFKNIGTEQGLPGNVVSAFHEDQDGYLWMGTRDGLARYDGVTMETWFHDPDDTTSLGSNTIGHEIVEDAKGRLWIVLHEHGLSRMDPGSGEFTTFSFANGRLPRRWMNDVVGISINTAGTAYVTCHDGIFTIDEDEVTLVSDVQALPPGTGPGRIRFALLVEDRWLWTTSTRGIACFDTREETWAAPSGKQGPAPGLFHPHLACHGTGSNGALLAFGTYEPPAGSSVRHLYLFDLRTLALDSVPIAPELVRSGFYSGLTPSVLLHSDGTIYIGTHALGLLEYHPNDGTWRQHPGGRNWSGDLLPGPIGHLYEDSQHRIWIGTESGVSLLAPDHQLFRNFDVVRSTSGEVLDLAGVRSVLAGPGNDLWLGLDDRGLVHLDSDKLLLAHHLTITGNPWAQRGYIDPSAMLGDTLICHVWADGLFRLDPGTARVFQLDDHRTSGEPELRYAHVHGTGRLLAFGWGRFGHLDPLTGAYSWAPTPTLADGRRDLAWAAAEDGEGMLWYGTEHSGLVRVHPDDLRTIGGWRSDPSVSPTTKVPYLVHHKGRIFFSLHGEGMGMLQVPDGPVSFLTKKDGLCSDHLSGFVNDADGDLWAYSSAGISWYNEARRTFRTFRTSDGMLSPNIEDAVLLPNGRIVLVSDRGLIEFDPSELKRALPAERPVVRSVQVMDREVGTEAWARGEALVIPHDRNYLRVEFTAQEFFDPERITFAYRLDDAAHWNHTTGRPVAIYSDLAGGTHRLCIKRTDLDGVWGPELCLPLFVTTPFYLRPWFLGLVALALIALGVLLYRWQLARRMALVQVRDRLSRDLHDDVGSALSSINLFSQVARQRLDDDTEKARELLDRIGGSASTMMRSMDDLVWTLDPENDRMDRLVARMRELALPLLEARDMECTFHVDPTIGEVKLDMVHRRNLFLIFKEAVNNLAKYSGALHARVALERSEGRLRLTVADDGEGFDPATKTDRHGLKNMRQRAQEIGGGTEITSAPGSGTTVVVTVPLP